jgi:hypothetical protein
MIGLASVVISLNSMFIHNSKSGKSETHENDAKLDGTEPQISIV